MDQQQASRRSQPHTPASTDLFLFPCPRYDLQVMPNDTFQIIHYTFRLFEYKQNPSMGARRSQRTTCQHATPTVSHVSSLSFLYPTLAILCFCLVFQTETYVRLSLSNVPKAVGYSSAVWQDRKLAQPSRLLDFVAIQDSKCSRVLYIEDRMNWI